MGTNTKRFGHLIEFVDSLPGMGKTEAAINLMAEHLLSDVPGLLIYVAPTHELLLRVKDDRLIPLLRKATPRQLGSIRSYDSKVKSDLFLGSVVASIRRDIEGGYEAKGNVKINAQVNGVLLVTHSAFFRLPMALKNKEHVQIIFDEARKCVFEPSTLPMTDKEEELFNQYLQEDTLPGTSAFKKIVFNSSIEVQAELKAKLEVWKKKRKVHAAAYGRFISMVESLELGTTEVYCLRRESKNHRQTTFQFYEVHIPSKIFSGWKRVIVMSAFLKKTQLWAMFCRSTFVLNGKSQRMGQRKDGAWIPVPAGRNDTAYYHLKDITQTFIPKYRQREQQILKRYGQAVIVSLTGTSKTKATWKHLISSTKLNGIFVKDKEAAQHYQESFKIFCRSHAKQVSKLTSLDLKRIINPTTAGAETLSEFGQALRDWVDSVEKVADAPYLWYLRHGLSVAKQWFTSDTGLDRPLFLANKNHMSKLQRSYPQAKQRLEFLPHSCHGLDNYKDHCMVLFQAATNPKKEARDFYESQIPWYDYNQDHIVETAIQAVTRTSIRDTTQSDPVLIVVPDPYLAALLSERLNDAPIEYANEKYGVPSFSILYITKPDLTVTERGRKFRDTESGKTSAQKVKDSRALSPFWGKLNSKTVMLSKARKQFKETGDDKAFEKCQTLLKEQELLSEQHAKWVRESQW